jgi:hypothetical protein
MSDAASTSTESEAPSAILARYDALWREFQATVSAMDEAELEAPARVGEWSAKDLLAHVGRWCDAAVMVIDNRLAGRPRGETYDDYEAWNARWAEEDRNLSVEQARQRCEAGYARLRGVIADLPTERWDKVVRGWVHASGVEHLEEHLADLRGEAQST